MSDEIKVTDEQALEWARNLSDQDKEELKRQALFKRALELADKKEPNLGRLSDAEFEAYKRSIGM